MPINFRNIVSPQWRQSSPVARCCFTCSAWAPPGGACLHPAGSAGRTFRAACWGVRLGSKRPEIHSRNVALMRSLIFRQALQLRGLHTDRSKRSTIEARISTGKQKHRLDRIDTKFVATSRSPKSVTLGVARDLKLEFQEEPGTLEPALCTKSAADLMAWSHEEWCSAMVAIAFCRIEPRES